MHVIDTPTRWYINPIFCGLLNLKIYHISTYVATCMSGQFMLHVPIDVIIIVIYCDTPKIVELVKIL